MNLLGVVWVSKYKLHERWRIIKVVIARIKSMTTLFFFYGITPQNMDHGTQFAGKLKEIIPGGRIQE